MTSLFSPLKIRSLEIRNRIVMSPMTREYSPAGVPGPDVAAYYTRRAAGGTGLIVTEGVAIDHPTAVDSTAVPRLHGDAALAGWRRVVDDVHAAGGRIVPQLWHVGPLWGAMARVDPAVRPMRPSGLWGTPGKTVYPQSYIDASAAPTSAMTQADIDDVIAAYVRSARNAVDVGFDGIAIHAGHGYLLDAFLWADTNRRDDEWGGDLERRTRFPVAVVRAIRAEIGDDLPIFYRFSQHKQQDYLARIADTPDELGVILRALAEAGVDVFDASGRRFDQPAFEGSPLTLAGWAKELTGAMSMAVGSVGLTTSLRDRGRAEPDSLDNVHALLGSGEIDLIAVGRLHLADPDLATTLRAGSVPVFDRGVHEATLH
ncbi:NADH:flavin oxidoreductase [Gordonia sp. (in: high G+C Gram-positive bacteria)]|uniref:NADH:flavin oxidoreductase n=1 Tax=Gordonia sp. (in: high G+C Gram-positive bacteria) TaxID=84139 RepID=UPI0016B0358F|nr:NADH:flavin oxidoreductase [Gordonia sp. (in: high G+C Gram-positive bacteria)]NLG46196.1 NADH:flavin oxidoreductase [Gordonia sp. (in: high G+C Gram-positive bacteria)]